MSVASELRRRVRAGQPLPRFEPCLPRPAKQPPAGPGWIHEIKHDGFRRGDFQARPWLLSRNPLPGQNLRKHYSSRPNQRAARQCAGQRKKLHSHRAVVLTKIRMTEERQRRTEDRSSVVCFPRRGITRRRRSSRTTAPAPGCWRGDG
jgi:hypothetical protein